MAREVSARRRDRWWLPTWRVAAVLLLLGLIVNLGVAVAISRWGVEPRQRSQPHWEKSLSPVECWPGPVHESWPSVPEASAADTLGVTLGLNPVPWQFHTFRASTGWQCQSLSCSDGEWLYVYEVHRIGLPIGVLRFDESHSHSYAAIFGAAPRAVLSAWYQGIGMSDGGRVSEAFPDWILPVMPVWSGLVVNTVAYAACLWIPWVSGIGWRRSRRLRGGECVTCRYPVVLGREVCPECGTAAPPSDRRVVNRAPAPSAQYALTSPNSEPAP